MTSTFLVTKGSQFSPCWLSGLTDHGNIFPFFFFHPLFLSIAPPSSLRGKRRQRHAPQINKHHLWPNFQLATARKTAGPPSSSARRGETCPSLLWYTNTGLRQASPWVSPSYFTLNHSTVLKKPDALTNWQNS